MTICQVFLIWLFECKHVVIIIILKKRKKKKNYFTFYNKLNHESKFDYVNKTFEIKKIALQYLISIESNR